MSGADVMGEREEDSLAVVDEGLDLSNSVLCADTGKFTPPFVLFDIISLPQ